MQLNLTENLDNQHLEGILLWFSGLRSFSQNCLPIRMTSLQALVTNGQLVDERATSQAQKLIALRTTQGTTHTLIPGIRVPAAPPPYPGLAGPRTRARRRSTASSTHQTLPPARSSQYFAMTMSAFDCSHRSGVPGTPEISLPEDMAGFFPPVSRQGRRYPDAYFDTALNEPSGRGKIITLRIWQRPPGSGTGHADWRINVKHDIIDLTTPAGGDILLFERLPSGSNPPYEVWVVPSSHPDYTALLARCIRQVQASGSAGTKQYGLF
jgi:hypothetical protein